MMWRQGDVFVERVEGKRSQAVPRGDTVIAEGEATGHQHRILDPDSAQLFGFRGQMFLEVVADFAQLVHDEHATICLDRGTYHVWRQREYDPSRFGRDGRSRSRLVLD